MRFLSLFMPRRRFVGIASASLLANPHSSAATRTLNSIGRLTTPSEQYDLLELKASAESFFALLRLRRSQTEYVVARYGLDGALGWSFSLPPGFPAIAPTADGGLLVLMRTLPLSPSNGVSKPVDKLRLAPDGSQLSVENGFVPAMPLSFTVCADTLIAYYTDGTVRSRDLTSNGTEVTRFQLHAEPISGFKPTVVTAALERTGADRVTLVDHTSPRMVSIDVTSGSVQTHRIVGGAIEPSLSASQRFVEAQAHTGRGGKIATPVIFAATAGSESGRLFCLASPINPEKTRILEVTAGGDVVGVNVCAIPARSEAPDKAPMFIAVAHSTLAIGFPRGDIFTYPV